MEVRLFGELEALAGGVPVPVRGARQRALLALLALQRGAAAIVITGAGYALAGMAWCRVRG